MLVACVCVRASKQEPFLRAVDVGLHRAFHQLALYISNELHCNHESDAFQMMNR